MGDKAGRETCQVNLGFEVEKVFVHRRQWNAPHITLDSECEGNSEWRIEPGIHLSKAEQTIVGRHNPGMRYISHYETRMARR